MSRHNNSRPCPDNQRSRKSKFFLVFSMLGLLSGSLGSQLLADDQDAQTITLGSSVMTVLTVNAANCGSRASEVLNSFACTSEVGSYQMGRLGLSVEALANALIDTGVSSTSSDLQRAIFEDIVDFGITRSISIPAMNLVDISHSAGSPFGELSGEIASASLIALEYIHPGVIENAGFTFDQVSAMGEYTQMLGPRDFNQYMLNHAGKALQLSDLEIFDIDGETGPLVEKIVISDDLLAQAGGNLLTDYVFDPAIADGDERSQPIAQLMSNAGIVAMNSGRPLTDRHTGEPNTAQSFEHLGDLPFYGIACVDCVEDPSETAAQVEEGFRDVPVLPSAQSIEELSVASMVGVDNSAPSGKSFLNGFELMAAAREAGERAVASNAASEDSAGTEDTEQSTDSSATTKAVCYAACVVAETVQSGGKAAAQFTKVAGDVVFLEGGEQYEKNLETAVEEGKNFLIFPKRCFTTCENQDNPIDDLPDAQTTPDSEAVDSTSLPDDDTCGPEENCTCPIEPTGMVLPCDGEGDGNPTGPPAPNQIADGSSSSWLFRSKSDGTVGEVFAVISGEASEAPESGAIVRKLILGDDGFIPETGSPIASDSLSQPNPIGPISIPLPSTAIDLLDAQ